MTLRVLQALAGGSIGGTELSVFALAPKLMARGVDVEVSLLDGHGTVSGDRVNGSVAVHDLTLGRAGLGGITWRFRRLMADGRFDLVHLYGLRMATIGRLAARTLGRRPVVVHGIRGLHVTEGGDPAGRGTRLILAFERQLARWTDAYLANSAGARDFMVSHGLPPGKFEVIPNGVDLERWLPQPPRPARSRPMVVCVANFRPLKRHQDLVDAMARVTAEGVELACCFAGDGATLEQVRARANGLGLGDRVTFVGSVPPGDMPALLSGADIAVLPSLSEGMSVGILEAMASGLPVIATDVPGTRETVVDGETGYLVPVRRPDVLAARLSELGRDHALRRRLGEAGRRRVEQHFTLDQNVERHVQAYERLVARHRRPTHIR